MDRQGPPIRPRYQLTRGLNRIRHEKDAHSVTSPAGSFTGRLFLTFGGTGRANR